MKTLLPLLLLLFINNPHCYAQPSKAEGHSLLWKIEKDGQPASYVFGTIHAICTKDYIWTQPMANALKATDAVCFEMNLNDPELPMKIARGLMETGNKQLSDYFTPAQYTRLKQYMQDTLHQNIEQFARMKPFVLQSLFITGMTVCDSMVSFEDNILKDALALDKKILGLETAEQQLKIVNDIPTDSIVKYVMDQVDHKAAATDEDKMYREMIQAYKEQNLPALDNIISAAGDLTDMKGELLDDRNTRWMATMRAHMKTQTVFFAVGAGHLWGKNGIIQLLRMLGYRVSEVR